MLAVKLSLPSGQSGSYTGFIGFNPRRLKGPKRGMSSNATDLSVYTKSSSSSCRKAATCRFIFYSLAKNQHLHAVGKTGRWIEKWLSSFIMGTTSSTIIQNLGEIKQSAPAVGAKIWCLYVCFFRLSRSEARALFVRWTHFEQNIVPNMYMLFYMKYVVLCKPCHDLWVD